MSDLLLWILLAYLREIDGALAVEVFSGVVVSQLMLDGVHHEPSLLPGLQAFPALVEIALGKKNVQLYEEIQLLSVKILLKISIQNIHNYSTLNS